MDVFEQHRPRLLRLAYRLLGVVDEAEDVVQDAYVRWQGASEVKKPGAYLSTTVTRLCLDVLKSARVKRQDYVGQWLPEVFVEEETPESINTLACDLSYGFMTMLERLTPEQRAVYVLRVAFDLDYAAIATTIGNSAASCRQLMKKAQLRMAGPARFDASTKESKALAERFARACNAADENAVMASLSNICRFMSDGGGMVNAARRPVVGANKVCRMLLGLQRKYGLVFRATSQHSGSSPLLTVSSQGVNGMAALDIDAHGAILGVFLQWNPKKIPTRHSHSA